jgi:hypothetical protein
MKDVTAEEHRGRVGVMRYNDAGQSFASWRSQKKWLYPILGDYEASAETDWKIKTIPFTIFTVVFGPITNLWLVIIVHLWWNLCIVLI